MSNATVAAIAQTPDGLRAPLITDDGTKGYIASASNWQFNGKLWQNQRASTGAAMWQQSLPNDGSLIGDVCSKFGTLVAAYGPSKLLAAATNSVDITRTSDSTVKTVGFVGSLPDFNTGDAFVEGTSGGVSKLYDQSGNGYHATQATAANMPPWLNNLLANGLRGLGFDGTLANSGVIHSLAIPSGVSLSTQAFTVIFIGQVRSNNVSAALFELGTHNIVAYTAANALQTNGASLPGARTAGYIEATPAVFVMTGSGSAFSMYCSDRSLASYSAATSATITGGLIGNTTIISQYQGSFELLGMLILNGSITTNQLAAIRQATYPQFNIQPQLKNRLVIAGDSISFGYLATNGLNSVRYMQQSLGYPIQVFNNSTPGQTLTTILASASYYFQNLAITGQNNIIEFQACTNDLSGSAGTTYTPSQVIATLQSAITAARAAGFSKVGAGTCLPRGGTNPITETIRQSYNSSVRALVGTGSTGLDFVVDYGGDATMGAASACTNSNLFNGDQTHPTNLGYAYLAAIRQAAIAPLLVAA
jgi:lysophospholipase L1-like esterase